MYLELFLSINYNIFILFADSELNFEKPFFDVLSIFFGKIKLLGTF
jgi:hypothetical protein